MDKERAVNNPSNVRKSSLGGRTKAQVCRLTIMHNFSGPRHNGRTSQTKEMLVFLPPQGVMAPSHSREGAYV